MLGNKNNFFKKKQTENDRHRKRRIYALRSDMRNLLEYDYGVDSKPYLHAYDYFINNPDDYDGSSFKADSYDIGIIDLEALLHDFEYVTLWKEESGLEWLKKKIKSDWKYRQGSIEFNGGGVVFATAYFIALVLSTPFYWTYKKIKDVQTRN